MQDEEIDIMIREAAEQHHPAYDDKSWARMEQLLDKHLPIKKSSKRWLFFLFLFLLLDASILLLVVRPWKKGSVVTVEKNSNSSTVIAKNKNQAVKDGEDLNKQADINKPSETNLTPAVNQFNEVAPVDNTLGNNNAANTTTPVTGNQKISSNAENSSGSATSKLSFTNNGTKVGSGQSLLKTKQKLVTSIQYPGTVVENNDGLPLKKEKKFIAKQEENDRVITGNTKPGTINNGNPAPLVASSNNDNAKTIAQVNEEKKKKQLTTEKAKDPQSTIPDKQKKKLTKGFGNNFGITLSGGADMSYVNIKTPGKTTFLYGAGLSYTMAKRVTVRSGFYVTKKIYSATPAEYNGTIYPNLFKIDGNCKVYEIPFSISYNLVQRKKHSISVSAGVSSYLMKKEAYNYEYKTPAGQYYYYKKLVDNENKHYFSVATVSGGYQYNLNTRFSVMAEPYIKLPLKGMGYGKMKLNSAGVLLTVTVKPFKKK